MLDLFKRKSDPEERLGELRSALAEAEAGLVDAEGRVGLAVADGDDSTAEKARHAVARHEARRRELRAAIPIQEKRVEEAREREAARHRREEQRRENAQREVRLAAARRLDFAFRELAAAHAEVVAALPGLAGMTRERLARRLSHALQAAAWHAAPDLCVALGLGRQQSHHWRPLAESEAGLIPQHQVAEEGEDR